MAHRTRLLMGQYLLLGLLLCWLPGCAVSTQSTQTRSERSPRAVSAPHRPAPERAATSPSTMSITPTDDQSGDMQPGLARPIPSDSTSANSAVASLLQQAAQARAAGNFARAQSLAERAQGLEPRQGHSYLELARIYHASGDTNRARQMALRGLQCSGNDAAMQNALRQISQSNQPAGTNGYSP